ncbi:hypothetical protein CRV107 [Nile crocodilepox virus]|uniref:Uncharacterized protein n=1 Tax=Nile crocodilepox virus (isolate Crocodylus niloticus/Zimbabwe/Ume/2001) TaxID=1289473 RepID=Q070E4_CPRVZ|nr:hypothetical protein CRV107 [Nile crocodilepox virus]ABJ08998.1 hypothetical protein CRV107 [Nile crocodilepox virus]
MDAKIDLLINTRFERAMGTDDLRCLYRRLLGRTPASERLVRADGRVMVDYFYATTGAPGDAGFWVSEHLADARPLTPDQIAAERAAVCAALVAADAAAAEDDFDTGSAVLKPFARAYETRRPVRQVKRRPGVDYAFIKDVIY